MYNTRNGKTETKIVRDADSAVRVGGVNEANAGNDAVPLRENKAQADSYSTANSFCTDSSYSVFPYQVISNFRVNFSDTWIRSRVVVTDSKRDATRIIRF